VIDADGYFGERVAAVYDDPADPMFAPERIDPVVDVLAELADDGRALELASGTGRIAISLARRGVLVHGIELSRAMTAKLQAKPGAEQVTVTIGDMATTRVPGLFRVAYLVYNTIQNLTTQDAQVACFRNVAAHLAPGGTFVIEVAVPPLRLLPPGQDILGWRASPDRMVSYHYDTATQAYDGHYMEPAADGALYHHTIAFRYVWPAELDLMAQLAGMRLRDRWAGWDRAPFTSQSRSHVSIWEKPAG